MDTALRGRQSGQPRRKFEKALDEMLADDTLLASSRIRDLLADMRAEWAALDRRIDALDQEFAQLARTDEAGCWGAGICWDGFVSPVSHHDF
ncbi:hypothetical protein [Sphingobium tyrosinilyticum]|uniref:Uncharacterized protein n=1 Tax=Sphingobium tyrosinilyticum TaxID=2715436 RepID=A0ABV9ETN3_9SPHN